MLQLTDLGHVGIGCLLCFISCVLVGLHLQLQLVDKVLQACQILAVFLSLVSELFNPFLDLLLTTFHGDLLCLVETVLQVFDCLLHVLFHALQMCTGVTLHLLLDSQGLISRLKHPLVVSLGFLYLVEFQLGSEDLAFFMFQRSFSLLKCRLELVLFLFKLLSDLF
uniref:Uncharacterized protein n=1 Tax=Oryzias melastigma TaxID=30732 RepID=A0A3B3C564_ORYME